MDDRQYPENVYLARKIVGCVSLCPTEVIGRLLARSGEVMMTLEREKASLLIRLVWREPDGQRVVVEARDIALLWWHAAARLMEYEGQWVTVVTADAPVPGSI